MTPAQAEALHAYYEVKGPSALGGSWRRFWHLTWMLAVTEYKLTYFGSALGYFWTLMRPLMLFGVLYVVFSEIFAIGAKIPNYPVVLLMSIMLWTFFSEVTSAAVACVVNRENLVRKIHFPRMAIPLSVTLTGVFNLIANLVAVFVFLAIYGIEPRLSWLLLPVLLVPLIAFATGIGMILSALFVRYRDVGPIWAVLQTALFYATPILYVIEIVPASARMAMMSSPIATNLELVRMAVIDPGAASPVTVLGGPLGLLIPIGILVVTCAFGFWLFNREAPRIAEDL